jgi:predicted acylesterase/phospholipase RssA
MDPIPNWTDFAYAQVDAKRRLPIPIRPLKVALALSGGGAMGDFEVGALAYLYERRFGFCAKMIIGTSVGSVNALQLAHGGGPKTQREAHAGLVTFWKKLSPSNHFIVETPLLQNIGALRNRIHNLNRKLATGGAGTLVVFPMASLAALAPAINDVVKAVDQAQRLRSLYTLAPLSAMIDASLSVPAVQASGVKLLLCSINLETGEQRYVDERGAMLDRDQRPLPAKLMDSPACDTLAEDYNNLSNALTEKSLQRRGHSELGDQGEYWVDDGPVYSPSELADLSDAVDAARRALEECKQQNPPVPRPLSLRDAALASSAIPGMFEPVRLDEGYYVDGGMRSVLPLEPAVASDADVIVAINAARLGIPPATSFLSKSILDILERSLLQILLWEPQERQMARAREECKRLGKSLYLIAPRLQIHDGFTVDPGLIDINMDYGYLAAADVVGEVNWESPASLPPGAEQPADPRLGALADAITQARMICWFTEFPVHGYTANESHIYDIYGPAIVPDPVALDKLRKLKTLVRCLALTRQILGGALPPWWESWWRSYERHGWPAGQNANPDPWSSFPEFTGRGRDAATANTTSVVKDTGSDAVYLIRPAYVVQLRTSAEVSQVLPAGDFPLEIPSGIIEAVSEAARAEDELEHQEREQTG